MIDPPTYSRYVEAEILARNLGMSLPEVLDRKRLLWTVKREHDTKVEALEDLLRRLDRQSPNKIMAYFYGRADGTAMEMFTALQQWLEAVIRNQADQTLGDL